ncbi:MAG: hypothetical protein H0V29_05250, partial [Thermoleophilaceae bacterium]|nr:hypothetical protein [Thermoleophilaceae bacterium]
WGGERGAAQAVAELAIFGVALAAATWRLERDLIAEARAMLAPPVFS